MAETPMALRKSLNDITMLLAITARTDPKSLTPRQKKGLEGGEACILLCAHPGNLDADEIATLAKAGLIFGAVLAGER